MAKREKRLLDVDTIPSGQELREAMMRSYGVENSNLIFRENIFYSTKDVCERLGGISRPTLSAWRKKYEIPYFKASERSNAMYSGKDLLDFLEKIKQS